MSFQSAINKKINKENAVTLTLKILNFGEGKIFIPLLPCKDCLQDGIKVALKVTRLFYMKLLTILLPVNLPMSFQSAINKKINKEQAGKSHSEQKGIPGRNDTMGIPQFYQQFHRKQNGSRLKENLMVHRTMTGSQTDGGHRILGTTDTHQTQKIGNN